MITSEMIEKIHDIILCDHEMNLSEIVDIVSISKECVENILHEKSSSKMVPRLLTIDQKHEHVIASVIFVKE